MSKALLEKKIVEETKNLSPEILVNPENPVILSNFGFRLTQKRFRGKEIASSREKNSGTRIDTQE